MCLQGTTVGLLGVTLIDMKTRLNTGYDHLSNAIMCRYAGSLFGTFLGGFVINKFRTRLDGCLTVTTFVMAMTFLGISMVKNLYTVAVFYAFYGLFDGITFVGNRFCYYACHISKLITSVSIDQL